MKKMILFALALLMAVGVMAQKQGYFLVYNIATSTTPTTEYIKKGSYVMIMNDTTLYLSKINIGRGSTMAATLLASGSNHAIINRAIFGGKAITFFVDTANAQNVYGVKSFKNNAAFAGTVSAVGNVGIGTTAYNKFTVAGTTGNTAIAGTLSVAGVANFTAVPKTTIGTGATNTGFGYLSSASLTSGGSNSAYGVGSLNALTEGSYNDAFGHNALNDVTIGSANASFGASSMEKNTSGQYNCAFGYLALGTNSLSSNNSAFGAYSLRYATGGWNTAVGHTSGNYTTSGAANSFFGFGSGQGIKTGSNNIAIGYNSGPAGVTSTLSDRLYISNKAGGADTAIIYGVMGATPAASSLQLNGAVHVYEGKGTANIALFQNDKTTAGDSAVVINKLGYVGIGKATATVPLDVVGAAAISGALAVTGATTVTGGLVGTAITRGTAAFTTTGTRVAVAITGATNADFYIVTPVAPNASSRPVAGDLISVIAKADSVVFQRQAGTTSGGSFNYFRIK